MLTASAAVLSLSSMITLLLFLVLSFSFNIDEIGIEDTTSIPEVLAFIVIANIEII
jgi:hypothetical protein